MCCGDVCVPTKRAECLLRASAPQEPFQPHTSTREERAEGSPCSLWVGLQYNKLPSLFSPVETSDHGVSFYVSDGIFSHFALCCNGTSTRENTHGKLYEDSGQSQLRWGGGVGHFPITDLLENVWKISSLHSCLTFSSGFDYIHFKFWSGGDVILLRVLAVILFLKLCCPSWEPATTEHYSNIVK